MKIFKRKALFLINRSKAKMRSFK